MMSDTDPQSLGIHEVEAEPEKKPVISKEEEEDENPTSGYGTESIEIGRSDTLESVSTGADPAKDGRPNLFDDDDDDDLFKSARMEPEPRQTNGFNGDAVPEADKEISLDDEEEESPFKDAHLQPDLQLSGGGTYNVGSSSAASAVLGGMVGPARNAEAILGGNLNPPANFYEGLPIEEKKMDGPEEFIDVKVIEPHRMGEGMSSYIVYKVVTHTNASFFKKKEFFVIRRFSDFLGLHQKLTEKYLQNGRIIPPAPDKNMMGTTKIKMSKEADGALHDDFVERRRAALERFMNRTAAHPSLRTDPDFREFLELDADLPKSSQTATLSSKNVLKFISKVGDSLTTITLKMEETDEWFEEKGRVIQDLDEQLQKLHYSTEALAEYRKNLAVSTGNVSRTLAVLSGHEENASLSGALSQLSEVQKTMEQIHNEQAAADFFFLSELIKDYIGLVGAVKDALQERVKAWQAWQNATASLTKKREAKVKAELQQKTERVLQLRQEIADLERQQDLAQENFDRISRLIKKEVEYFDIRKAEDFKKSILKYLEAILKTQERIASQWEHYLPKVQQISS